MSIYNLHEGDKVQQGGISVERSKEGQARSGLGTRHNKPVRTAEVPVSEEAASILWASVQGGPGL